MNDIIFSGKSSLGHKTSDGKFSIEEVKGGVWEGEDFGIESRHEIQWNLSNENSSGQIIYLGGNNILFKFGRQVGRLRLFRESGHV